MERQSKRPQRFPVKPPVKPEHLEAQRRRPLEEIQRMRERQIRLAGNAVDAVVDAAQQLSTLFSVIMNEDVYLSLQGQDLDDLITTHASLHLVYHDMNRALSSILLEALEGRTDRDVDSIPEV